MRVRRFEDLRAWQHADAFKKATLRICEAGSLAQDFDLRRQLERAASAPPAHLAEGFGRFNPLDFARFTVMARSSLMEAQNHLHTVVDKGLITDAIRVELDDLAETAIREATALMTYLHSAEALVKARRVRENATMRRERRMQKAPNAEREP